MRLLFLFVDCLWSPVANSAGFSHTRTHAFSRRHTHTAHICFFSVVGEQYDSCLTRNACWINRRKASTASTMYCVTFTQQFFSAHNSYCVHQASRTTHEYGRCAKSHTLCQGRYIYKCGTIADTTRVHTGSIILEVSAGMVAMTKHQKCEKLKSTETRNKYLHWERYNWRQSDVLGGWHGHHQTESIHINTVLCSFRTVLSGNANRKLT